MHGMVWAAWLRFSAKQQLRIARALQLLHAILSACCLAHIELQAVPHGHLQVENVQRMVDEKRQRAAAARKPFLVVHPGERIGWYGVGWQLH